MHLSHAVRHFVEQRVNVESTTDVPLLLGLWARVPFLAAARDAEDRLTGRLARIREEVRRRAEESIRWALEQEAAEKQAEIERKIYDVEEKHRLKMAARRKM
jgi:hypothetical protein